MPGQQHSQPLWLRWVKSVCVFRCNLPSALLAEQPGSFCRHCGNTGVERTPDKSQHTTLTLEKKILPPLLPGFELSIFRSRLRRSYQQTIPTTRIGLVYIIIMFGKSTFYKQQAARHRDSCFARERLLQMICNSPLSCVDFARYKREAISQDW